MPNGFPVLRSLILLIALASGVPAASAAIVVNNWTIDLGGVTGPNTDLVIGIDRVGFSSAIKHVEVTKGINPNTGLPNTGTSVEPGDTAQFRNLIRFDTFLDEDGLFTGTGGPIFSPLLNAPAATPGAWEMTAKSQISVLFMENGGGFLDFIHLGGPGTFFNLYLDEYGGGASGIKSSPLTGLGYDDGDLIAEFIDTFTGESNPFSPSSQDGSDDAQFAFIQGLAGVVYDFFGNDLLTGGSLHSIQTDQNFDTFNPLGVVPSMFAAAGGPFPGTNVANPQTNLNFFAFGDGSAVLLVIPEPGGFALCGLGMGILLSFTLHARRRAASTRRQSAAQAAC